MHVTERQMRIGEVAKATGVTVRALHHYDEIGLEDWTRLIAEVEAERQAGTDPADRA